LPVELRSLLAHITKPPAAAHNYEPEIGYRLGKLATGINQIQSMWAFGSA